MSSYKQGFFITKFAHPLKFQQALQSQSSFFGKQYHQYYITDDYEKRKLVNFDVIDISLIFAFISGFLVRQITFKVYVHTENQYQIQMVKFLRLILSIDNKYPKRWEKPISQNQTILIPKVYLSCYNILLITRVPNTIRG